MKYTTLQPVRKFGLLLIIPLAVTTGNAAHFFKMNKINYPSGITAEENPVQIKKRIAENRVSYTFTAASLPDENLYEAALSRFQRLEGFVSLKLKENNLVEVITTPIISHEDNTRLLSVTAKMYGYPGFNIIE